MSGRHPAQVRSPSTGPAPVEGVTAPPAEINLYDSLRRGVHSLAAASPVTIYSCGPMVLQPVHLAQLRHYVAVDLLRRVVQAAGGTVRQAMTIVDVARSLPAGLTGWDGDAHDNASAFRRDLQALAVTLPDTTFVLSEHIDMIVDEIRSFLRHGLIYETGDGLYFDTASLPDYGRLSGLVRMRQRVGRERALGVELRSPTDFAVWRAGGLPDDSHGFDSPWGRGLPGQHVPCVVFALSQFGERLDVHTGVEHHRELHHVNEMAQVQPLFGADHEWVRFWHHTAFVFDRGRRLTRGDAGGPLMLSDLRSDGVEAADLRFHLLGSHYRAPAAVDRDLLVAARRSRARLLARIERRELPPVGPVTTFAEAMARLPAGDEKGRSMIERIRSAALADVHTPRVLALVRLAVGDEDLSAPALAVLLSMASSLLGVGLARGMEPTCGVPES